MPDCFWLTLEKSRCCRKKYFLQGVNEYICILQMLLYCVIAAVA